MVVVVLDAPGLERVDEGSKHEGAHDVLDQVVLVEGAVARIVANHEELHNHEGMVDDALSAPVVQYGAGV